MTPTGPAPGPPPPWGGGKGFVQVQVHHVESHVSRTGIAEDGVGIGSVVVKQSPCLMDDAGNLQNVSVEQTERRRIGQHQGGGIRPYRLPERFEIDLAVLVGGNRDTLKPGDGSRGRICTVGYVRYQHLGPLFPARLMIGPDHQQACPFSLSSRSRLQRDLVHPRDGLQLLLQMVHQLQRPLHGLLRLVRMNGRKSAQLGHFFISLRVVLHRAGAKRDKTIVNSVVSAGQSRIMPDDIQFAHFRQLGPLRSDVGQRQNVLHRKLRHIELWQAIGAPAWPGPFKNKRLIFFLSHSTASNRSANVSISSFVLASVKASRTLFSYLG